MRGEGTTELNNVNTAFHAHFLHGVRFVRLNGLDAEREAGGDLFIRVTPCD